MDETQLLELKLYMHVYHDDDDYLIGKIWEAAKEYLTGGGIPQDGTSLVWLATAGVTLHWYDHPEQVGTDQGVPDGLRKVINQLKLDRGGESYF